MHPQCGGVLAEGHAWGAKKEGHWEGNPWLIPREESPWGRKCQLILPSSTWWGIGDSDQEKGCALSHTEGLSCLQVALGLSCRFHCRSHAGIWTLCIHGNVLSASTPPSHEPAVDTDAFFTGQRTKEAKQGEGRWVEVGDGAEQRRSPLARYRLPRPSHWCLVLNFPAEGKWSWAGFRTAEVETEQALSVC